MANSETNIGAYLHDPDVQLMLRAQAGDNAAFTQLVELYQERLVAVLYHLLGNQEASEDLAQEVFLRIYRTRMRYRPTAKFSTWMFRIANNLASTWRRDNARFRQTALVGSDSGARLQEQLVAEKSGLMPTRILDRSEMSKLVRDALDTLNERQKLAVLLNKFEQMSYEDIAVAMELSPQAVKSLLARARENLRVLLEPYL